MLTQEERIIGQMLCSSPMAQGVGTAAIAQRLDIRNDQAAYTLCRMRQKGYVFTKTAESTAMGYSVWHCTKHFSELLAQPTACTPNQTKDTTKKHYRIMPLNGFMPAYIEGTMEDALAKAKYLSKKEGPSELWQRMGIMRYVPPQPQAGTYELE